MPAASQQQSTAKSELIHFLLVRLEEVLINLVAQTITSCSGFLSSCREDVCVKLLNCFVFLGVVCFLSVRLLCYFAPLCRMSHPSNGEYKAQFGHFHIEMLQSKSNVAGYREKELEAQSFLLCLLLK